MTLLVVEGTKEPSVRFLGNVLSWTSLHARRGCARGVKYRRDSCLTRPPRRSALAGWRGRRERGRWTWQSRLGSLPAIPRPLSSSSETRTEEPTPPGALPAAPTQDAASRRPGRTPVRRLRRLRAARRVPAPPRARPRLRRAPSDPIPLRSRARRRTLPSPGKCGT